MWHSVTKVHINQLFNCAFFLWKSRYSWIDVDGSIKHFMEDFEVSRKLYHHVSFLKLSILLRIIKARIIRSHLIVMHALETQYSVNDSWYLYLNNYNFSTSSHLMSFFFTYPLVFSLWQVLLWKRKEREREKKKDLFSKFEIFSNINKFHAWWCFFSHISIKFQWNLLTQFKNVSRDTASSHLLAWHLWSVFFQLYACSSSSQVSCCSSMHHRSHKNIER